VDAVFPKDVRASAQGLFNLLILGAGMVVASFLFPAIQNSLVNEPVRQKLLADPAVMAIVSADPKLASYQGGPPLADLAASDALKETVAKAWSQSDWQTLFLVPSGLALLAIVLLAVCFRPPTRGPEAAAGSGPAAH
jgi:hypothetical protein